jgi:hypothetical protein
VDPHWFTADPDTADPDTDRDPAFFLIEDPYPDRDMDPDTDLDSDTDPDPDPVLNPGF